MGNCFSAQAVTERRPSEVESGESGPEDSVTSAVRNPSGDDSARPIICSQCHGPCDHTDSKFYLKCLQCLNDYICKQCYAKALHHPSHVYAFVDNENRHRFMELFAQRMDGWPILGQVPVSERQSLQPVQLKCMNLTTSANLLPKRCPNPVSWICLQCRITFSLCDSCMGLPHQHTGHVFAMASTDTLQKIILSEQNFGSLPLT